MKSLIKTYQYEDGEIQRVQLITCDSFDDLEFFTPKFSKNALKHLASIYQDFFVKKAPLIFGEMIIYHLPDNIELPFTVEGIEDKYVASRIFLTKNRNSNVAKDFMKKLEDNGYLYRVKGKNPFMHTFMPYKDIGFISNTNKKSKLKVNSSFFTFDLVDCDSLYDIYGTPIGLMVKNGKIINPPLFNREALLVDKTGKVTIKKINLKDLELSISGRIYERPNLRRTPMSDYNDVIIIKDKVVAINKGGNSIIPSTGFVINTNDKNIKVGDVVTYKGLEDITFGIQCGNSVIINGKPTTSFISKFYHLFKPGEVQYPPSNYPHNFEFDRAPRIVLGADKDNKPVILWFEGASKMKHEKGVDSCGASLKELGNIVKDLGIKNAINLDGGGSAQIIYNGKRELLISDRDFSDNSESERPVPIGIVID